MNIKYLMRVIKKLPPNAKVLDAGCGWGDTVKYIRKLRKDVEIHGVDIFEEKGIMELCNFHISDVCSLSEFKDNHFDLIVCFHVIEHVKEPHKMVKEFHRILKKNCSILLETPHWITIVSPIGANFYDEPTHIRPYTKVTLKLLFEKEFNIKRIKFDTPSSFYLSMPPDFKGATWRKILHFLGMYKICTWMHAEKK